MALVLIPVGLVSILIGIALLVVTTAIYFLGRNRMRASLAGLFLRALVKARPRFIADRDRQPRRPTNLTPRRRRHAIISALRSAGIGRFQ